MATPPDITQFHAEGRALRGLFLAVRPVAMRVRLFRRLEKIGRSRRKPQPTCAELKGLVRQKAIPLGQRLPLLWLHCGRTDRRKWLITSQDYLASKPIADRFEARTHNVQRRRDIGPCGAEHWPDRDAPPRNQVTSQDIFRIARSLDRFYPFLKRRRQCCEKFL